MIYLENILICIAAPLLIAAFFLHGDARKVTLSFAVGMFISLLSAYISGFLEYIGVMPPGDIQVYLSPVVEEIMKLLPLLFLLLVMRQSEESFFLEAVALGTGFATFENCCYILASGSEDLTYILIRGLAVGVMHLVSVLMLVLGIILARRVQAVSLPTVVGALSTAMCFHALYNLLVSRPGLLAVVGYAMPLLTAAILYLPYRQVRRGL